MPGASRPLKPVPGRAADHEDADPLLADEVEDRRGHVLGFAVDDRGSERDRELDVLGQLAMTRCADRFSGRSRLRLT